MLIDVSREPTVLNLKVQRQREKASAEIVNSAEPLLDAIAEACRRRFSERRRLFDGDLESISQVMLREFDTAVSSIVSFDHKREPTRVRPKGDAIEHFRMFVGPGQKSGQDKAAIWSLHLYATRKHAMIEFRRFPSTWKAHVSARMHERIEADLDAERDFLMRSLGKAGMLVSTQEIAGVGATTDGRNGGGDRYVTDGKAMVGVIPTLP